jgi:hypothetical protein
LMKGQSEEKRGRERETAGLSLKPRGGREIGAEERERERER